MWTNASEDVHYVYSDEPPDEIHWVLRFFEPLLRPNESISTLNSSSDVVTWASPSTAVSSSSPSLDLQEQQPLEIEYNWLFLLLLLFVITGGLGNVLVCLAICLERRLQNVTNYFLLSLAIADLLVCIAVMPFGILDEFYGSWPFGWHACNFWVTCDVLSCSSSIIHMCFISLGRYMGIRNPLKTRGSSKKAVLLKIAAVWLVSMVITSPITVLGFIDSANIQPSPEACAINNRFFFVFGSMFAFYIPMFLMIATYVLTVHLLQRKAKFCLNKPQGGSRRVTFARRSSHFLHCPVTASESGGGGSSSSSNGNLRPDDPSAAVQCEKCGHRMKPPKLLSSSSSMMRGGGGSRRSSPPQDKYSGGMIRMLGTTAQVKNEQKATKVLGLVFFAFVICWSPFFILNIVFAVLGPEGLPEYLATTFLWLGYVSSTINPIIYTIFNRTFKRAFWKLLTCRCRFGSRGHHHHLNRLQAGGELSNWGFKSARRIRSPQQTAC